jgi:hypothetical protein
MGVTSTNLIQGPATLYYGIFGATEPLTIDETPGVGWSDLGGTKDGVEMAVADEYAVLEVDQIIYEIGRTRTKRVLTVKTNLAEATLDNMARAINNSMPVANVLEGDDGVEAFLPPYGAILLDGIAPGGFRRRATFRKILQTDSVASSYKKDGQTLIPVTFAGHWVSSSVRPFRIEDAVA